MQVIDLSVLLDEETPVYPGDPETKLRALTSVNNDGHLDHYLSVVTHTGTHIDAPAHMLAEGKTLDKFPVSHFVGRGVYVKVENNTFNLESVKNAGIQAGDIVLFHTGMSDRYNEPSYWQDRPAMSEEIAQYLADSKVQMVGLDTGSADAKDSKDHPIHKILLGSDVLIIENMTNLAQLQGTQFHVYALPLRLNVDGAPTRAIAVVT